jgi:hypothetical protein
MAALLRFVKVEWEYPVGTITTIILSGQSLHFGIFELSDPKEIESVYLEAPH